MDSQRNILLIALLFVSFLLFQQWNMDSAPQTQGVEQQVNINGDVPSYIPVTANRSQTKAHPIT